MFLEHLHSHKKEIGLEHSIRIPIANNFGCPNIHVSCRWMSVDVGGCVVSGGQTSGGPTSCRLEAAVTLSTFSQFCHFVQTGRVASLIMWTFNTIICKNLTYLEASALWLRLRVTLSTQRNALKLPFFLCQICLF